MESLNELQEVERLEEEEEAELKQILGELARKEQHRDTVKRIYGDVEDFIEINREILHLTEIMNNEPENFQRIYSKIKSLISKHNQLGKNLLKELKNLGIPERQLQILYETDKKMKNIDEEIVEEIDDKRSEQAQKILNERPTIYFEAQPLQKFIAAVKHHQVRKKIEVPGIFGIQRVKDGYILNKFLELENTKPQYAGFKLHEQVQEMLEKYGNERDIIITHSHPPGDFTHSGPDKDIIKKANNIGVIGVPYKRRIYPVPELLKNNSWINLPSKVIHNDKKISESKLKQKFPEIHKYNKALKKAITKGNEKRWTNLI